MKAEEGARMEEQGMANLLLSHPPAANSIREAGASVPRWESGWQTTLSPPRRLAAHSNPSRRH